MARPSQVLVDTNVIFDVLHADATWQPWSSRQLERFANYISINPPIYAEICYHAVNQEEAEAVVAAFGLTYAELPRRALFLAAKAYQRYRSLGGVKTAPLADFFIGAHAAAENMPLISRDRGRYESYFPEVHLICP